MRGRRRRPWGRVLLVALLLMLGLGLRSLVGAAHTASRTPVYTVQRFLEGGYAFRMRRGQAALIRGSMRCLASGSLTCVIEGPATDSPGSIALMVYIGRDPPLLAAARRIPVVAGLIPPTAAFPLLNTPATYRVQFVGCAGAPACATGMTEWRLSDGGAL